MEGKKNDRPQWINETFSEFLRIVLFNNDASSAVKYLKESVRNLEENKARSDALRIGVELSKDPADYKVNNIQKKIGLHERNRFTSPFTSRSTSSKKVF